MTWTERTSPIAVDDKVAYSAKFLRDTGQQTGVAPQARGVVKELRTLEEMTLAVIDWGGADLPERVNVKNLAKVAGKGFALD